MSCSHRAEGTSVKQDIKIFNVALSQSWKITLEYYRVISRQVPETTEMSIVVVKGILGSQERIQVHFLIGSMASPCPWLQMGS